MKKGDTIRNVDERMSMPTTRPAHEVSEFREKRLIAGYSYIGVGMTVEQVERQIGPPDIDRWATAEICIDSSLTFMNSDCLFLR